MNIIFLLHFYQPHDQQEDILDRVVNESYRPLVNGLLERPDAKIVVNITGALTKLLDEKGYHDVLDGLKKLLERGQIEMTGSCMYHAFLPLIPEDEARRQIMLNQQTNSAAFGTGYNPSGFFSPEMAISGRVLDLVASSGYKWISAPQVASKSGTPVPERLYRSDTHKDLYIFFRNKRVSSLVLSATVRDAQELFKETQDLHTTDKYWFCVMDAETFGHHRIGHEKVLFEILDDPNFTPTLPLELITAFEGQAEPVSLRNSTWTNSEQDFHLDDDKNSFTLWKDPENPIHKLQWELMQYIIAEVSGYPDKDSPAYIKAREALDVAIASDQFWWASVKPWWSLEMVEQGAYNLRHVMEILCGAESDMAIKAEGYYRAILDKAFEWQRTGLIRKKHLENSATYLKEPFKDRTPKEWYNQIILELEDEMNKSAERRDFEKAVKWRDAILKLDQGTDIYDVLHVVDELWSSRQIPSVKPFLEHDWDELSDFAKKYLQSIKSKEELDEWKKSKQSDRQ